MSLTATLVELLAEAMGPQRLKGGPSALDILTTLVVCTRSDERAACVAIIESVIADYPNCDCGKHEILERVKMREGPG